MAGLLIDERCVNAKNWDCMTRLTHCAEGKSKLIIPDYALSQTDCSYFHITFPALPDNLSSDTLEYFYHFTLPGFQGHFFSNYFRDDLYLCQAHDIFYYFSNQESPKEIDVLYILVRLDGDVSVLRNMADRITILNIFHDTVGDMSSAIYFLKIRSENMLNFYTPVNSDTSSTHQNDEESVSLESLFVTNK